MFMNLGPDDHSDGGDGGTGAKLEIDGKTYTAADVKNLLTTVDSATQKGQQASKVLDAAKAYGVEPEEFVRHAEGAFTVITTLKEQGIISDNGEIIVDKNKNKNKETTNNDDDLEDDSDDDILGLLKDKDENKNKGQNKDVAESVVTRALKAVVDKIGKIEELVNDTRDTQTLLVRMDREEKIKAKFPNLEEGDVAKVFALTKELRSQGKKVKLEDVAKAISEEVAKKEVNIIKTFASKHGLDYDKIVTTTTKTGDESPLDEKGITTLLAGKKINLFPKDKKKEASPRDVIRGLNFRS